MPLGRALWRLAVDPVTFVVVCLLWCLDLGLGSLLAYQRPDIFGSMDAYPFALWLREVGRRALPWSAWVYLLAALTWAMTASLALCAVNWFWRRRGSLKGLGEVLVHLGFLLIFTGFVIEAVLGTRVHGVLVGTGDEVTITQLGLSLRLDKIDLTTSPAGDVLDTVSTLVVRRGAGSSSGTSRLNHPLIAGSTVVYPRGSRQVVTAVWLSTSGGLLRLEPGDSARLADGRRLVLRGILQPDEERGVLRGPAVYLALVGPAGQQPQSAVLAPGRGSVRATIGGLPVALERLEDRLLGRYDVHRDPGVLLVLLGAALLFAGTLWAFVTYVAGQGRGAAPATLPRSPGCVMLAGMGPAKKRPEAPAADRGTGLGRYHAKRDFARTPEPAGAAAAEPVSADRVDSISPHHVRGPRECPDPTAGPRRCHADPQDGIELRALHARVYVIQKHHAAHLHYDLRLESGGVLKSWAVPKGPSLDPADRRLAVEVEDHPLDYAGFEGAIPAGEYGAGSVIVWDRGTFRPRGEASFETMLERGAVKIEIAGEKLAGGFALVRTRFAGKKNNWLLIKEQDAHARPGSAVTDEAPCSVLSGRDVDDPAGR